MKDKLFYSVHKIEKSLKHHVIEWLAATVSILGAILNAQMNIYGFYLFIIGNVLWISFSIKHKHYGLLASSIAFLVVNLYAIRTWSGSA